MGKSGAGPPGERPLLEIRAGVNRTEAGKTAFGTGTPNMLQEYGITGLPTDTVFSGGLTGRITTLLVQAAELAIRDKSESISLALLDRAAAAGIFKLPAEQEPDEADV